MRVRVIPIVVCDDAVTDLKKLLVIEFKKEFCCMGDILYTMSDNEFLYS